MFNRPSLEGAECASLNPKVADKFFDIDAHRDRLRRKAAENICARCVVQPDCLEDALNGPDIERGIIAGITAAQLALGKTWRHYDEGLLDRVPKRPRPDWMMAPLTESAQMVEWTRLEEDADELSDAL